MDFLQHDSVAARYEVVNPVLKRTYPFGTAEDRYQNILPSNNAVDGQIFNGGIEASEEIVCFGSIVNVEVRLHNLHRINLQNSKSSSLAQLFNIRHDGEYFSLLLAEVVMGRLNKGMCRHLHKLVSKQQVYIAAYVLTSDWEAAVSSLRHDLRTELNVYGSRKSANEVGRILSESDVFLQRPQYGLEANIMEYYNPHILRLEDFSDTGPVEQREQSSRATPRPPGTNGDEDGVSSNDDAELETILDSLSHRLVAQEISPIPNIKSKLHPHQKEAVDFVFRREMGQLSSDLSLWKYDDTDPNEPFYRHVLSGSKRPEPAEITGGIIADDMGLGKSLVMISTIVSSIDRAKEFVASQSSRKIACPATLIIVPSSLLIDNWVDEIRKHTNPGSLAFYKYLGPDRHKEEQHLREALVVFTTYATAAAEFQRSDGHNLASFNWFRVVIDEAHYIRNRSTRQFQAIASIPALYRWCLTGTPIQNSLEDLGSLVTFLKVPILEKSPAFSRFIMKPIQSGSRSGFQNLRTLLQTICIRRTNRILKDLPKPVREKRMVAFTPVEWSQYRDLIAEGAKRIDMAISRRGRKTPSSVKLESLLRLRLFCNNGAYSAGLELAPEGLPVDPDEALAYLQQQSQDMCVYCSSMIYSISNKIKNTDGAILIPSCGHLVCHRCLAQHRHDKLCCPTCANGNALPLPVPPAAISDMSTDVENPNSARNSQRVGDFPSKLLALLDDIRPNKTHKSIVFSSWKKTLHLVGRMLTRHGIPYNIIEGSMPLSERLKVLKDYQSIMGTNILLMTLGTGAVGLNLAITSRIYLLEPQWNPTIEDQAIGRALRLDQTNQVTIIRYIMRDSIEEMSVLFRQERKIKLASDGLGNRNRDISPQRSQAVQDVFSKVFLK